MSDLVYPVLPGLMFGATKAPIWSTVLKTAASGREYRASLFQVPRYRYTLQYEFLRDQVAYTELPTLLSFFNQVGGNWDSFLFSDPDDNAVTAQAFGIGDGTTLVFQLVRTLGSFVEPVYCPQAGASIYVNGTLTGGATVSTATGLVTFTTAPAGGAALTWSGSSYWRCRFDLETLEFSKFMQDLWDAKRVTLITVKP